VKPLPLTVNVNGQPAIAEAGLREPITGGGRIVKVALLDDTLPDLTVIVAFS
jgi:hypothetical protein